MFRSLWVRIAALFAAAAVVATPLALTQGSGKVDVFVGSTPTPVATATPTATPTTTANLWVDSNGGTCTRQGTAGAYSDAGACSTVDAAWDAATAGDTVCVRPGSYVSQLVTGNKASETFVKGCGGTVTITSDSAQICGYQDGALCANGNHMTLQDVDLDAEDRHGASIGAEVNGNNVTWLNVNVRGLTPSIFVNAGSGFHWNGGEHGEDQGGNPVERRCDNGDGQPLQFDTGSGTVENIYFWPNDAALDDPSCGADNSFHLETNRLNGAGNMTIRNNYYAAGSGAGSGHLFFTFPGAATGQVIEGNYFGEMWFGGYAAQTNANIGTCDFTWRYNTFEVQFAPSGCDGEGTWTGNLGVAQCGGTHSNNVWIGTGSCSGDTFTGGSFAALGLSAAGRPQSGSAAVIGAGGSACSSLGADFDGNTRPTGAACEAGAFEYVP